MNYDALTQLWRTNKLHWDQQVYNANIGIEVTQVDRLILSALAQHDKLTKKQLAEQLHTIPQNLTRSLNRLISATIIEIEKDDGDLRKNFLTLTTKGRKLSRKLDIAINQIWQHALQGLTKQQILDLETMLAQINANLTLE